MFERASSVSPSILAAAVVAAFSLAGAGAAAAQEVGLFLPVEAAPADSVASAAQAPGADDSATIRERRAGIDFSRLAVFAAAVSRSAVSGGAGDVAGRAVPSVRLPLNLFEDTFVTAVVDRVAPTSSGYALWGDLEGLEWGTLTLVVNGTVVVGTVRSSAGTYVIAPSGDGVVVRQEDHSRMAPAAEPLVRPPAGDSRDEPPAMRGPDGERRPDGGRFGRPAHHHAHPPPKKESRKA